MSLADPFNQLEKLRSLSFSQPSEQEVERNYRKKKKKKMCKCDFYLWAES